MLSGGLEVARGMSFPGLSGVREAMSVMKAHVLHEACEVSRGLGVLVSSARRLAGLVRSHGW